MWVALMIIVTSYTEIQLLMFILWKISFFFFYERNHCSSLISLTKIFDSNHDAPDENNQTTVASFTLSSLSSLGVESAVRMFVLHLRASDHPECVWDRLLWQHSHRGLHSLPRAHHPGHTHTPVLCSWSLHITSFHIFSLEEQVTLLLFFICPFFCLRISQYTFYFSMKHKHTLFVCQNKETDTVNDFQASNICAGVSVHHPETDVVAHWPKTRIPQP